MKSIFHRNLYWLITMGGLIAISCSVFSIRTAPANAVATPLPETMTMTAEADIQNHVNEVATALSGTMTAIHSPTQTTVSFTATPESECTRLKLSSQECANLGEHLFTLSGEAKGYCSYGANSESTVIRDLRMVVSFSNDDSGKKVTIFNGAFTNCPAIITNDNVYYYDCIYIGNHNTGIIKFVDDGFINQGNFTNSAVKNCKWSEYYKLP